MGGVHVIAGLDWDIAIRGILVVLVGVVVLPGSVYLLLGTNLGARLGFSVAAAGLFGFLTILTAVWWIQPPGIGPMGRIRADRYEVLDGGDHVVFTGNVVARIETDNAGATPAPGTEDE